MLSIFYVAPYDVKNINLYTITISHAKGNVNNYYIYYKHIIFVVSHILTFWYAFR